GALAAGRPDRRGHPRIADVARRPAAQVAVAALPGPLLQGAQQLAAGAAQLGRGAAGRPPDRGGGQKGAAVPAGPGPRRRRRLRPCHGPGQRAGQRGLLLQGHRQAPRRVADAPPEGLKTREPRKSQKRREEPRNTRKTRKKDKERKRTSFVGGPGSTPPSFWL